MLIFRLYTDAGANALIGKGDDFLDRLLQLSVNGEHGNPMNVRPDVLSELRRGVRPDEALPLQRHDGIDQPLKVV